jgi:hypothetical protein
MGNREDLLKEYRTRDQLGADFEERVFLKIRRKKKQRKIAVSSLGVFLLGAALFMSGSLFFPGKKGPLYTKNAADFRQEVPVTDYVTFAASDDTHNYIIEQVGNFNDPGTI